MWTYLNTLFITNVWKLRQAVDDMRISHDIVKNKDNLTEEKSDTFPDDEQASTSAKKHLKCDECNDEFDQKEHLETHVREHHEWTCEYCEFRTINMNLWSMSMFAT